VRYWSLPVICKAKGADPEQWQQRGAATRTFEYACTLPANAAAGGWALTDVVPAGTSLYVSGALGFSYAGNVSYANRPGGVAPSNYVPISDSNGFDAAVIALRVAPTGTMAGASAGSQPAFTIRFRVRVN